MKQIQWFVLSSLLFLSACATEQSPQNTNQDQNVPRWQQPYPAAPDGCESFYQHYNENPQSPNTYYADTPILPTSDLGNYGNPLLATNGANGSLDVYSLRDHDSDTTGVLVLQWSGHTVCNGEGVDFTIFENGFFISGKAGESFIEPAAVAVSLDGSTWVNFPVDYKGVDSDNDGISEGETADPGSKSYKDWIGFAGIFPTLYNESSHSYLSHGADPFFQGDRLNPGAVNPETKLLASGGDSFDLDALPDTTEGNAIKTNGFRYIKITRANKMTNLDTNAAYPSVPDSMDQSGADIDAVYARYLKAIP